MPTRPEAVIEERARAARTRTRLILITLAVLFLGGIAVAQVLVQSGWRPAKTKNYGELVQPARPLADVDLTTLDGRRTSLSALRGKWNLVYFGPADCLSPCTDNLYKMRQIVAAQGKEAGRVARVFVVTDSKALDWLRYTLKDYPGMEIFTGPAAAVRALAEQFVLPGGGPPDRLHRVYVVDPLGNLMMSYPADADPSRMNKDLSFLLKASHIG